MIEGLAVLAIVPARSGSQGIPHKNMRIVAGMSLLARAGEVLKRCVTVDRAMLSTDAAEYQREGAAHGLDSWFLRPAELSTSTATAADTVVHALAEAERHYRQRFDILLIVEPTSPLREPADIDACVHLMQSRKADSVVSVSPADPKFHPRKLLRIESERLTYFQPEGAHITARQQLEGNLYFRNGLCYALRRDPFLASRLLFGPNTVPYVVERPLVNIDEPFELELAEFLLAAQARATAKAVH
jgi:CMP-N-acetylneuraminic acid synthetase